MILMPVVILMPVAVGAAASLAAAVAASLADSRGEAAAAALRRGGLRHSLRQSDTIRRGHRSNRSPINDRFGGGSESSDGIAWLMARRPAGGTRGLVCAGVGAGFRAGRGGVGHPAAGCAAQAEVDRVCRQAGR